MLRFILRSASDGSLSRLYVLIGAEHNGSAACFADSFISAWVSWQPHTLHAQSTGERPDALAALGYHFFDISLLH